MLNPVSVTSDGVRLFVTDLGFNRVLVWNSIPTSNTAPADFALGQPDLASAVPNNAYTVDSERRANAGSVHRIERHRHQRQSDVSRSPAMPL